METLQQLVATEAKVAADAEVAAARLRKNEAVLSEARKGLTEVTVVLAATQAELSAQVERCVELEGELKEAQELALQAEEAATGRNTAVDEAGEALAAARVKMQAMLEEERTVHATTKLAADYAAAAADEALAEAQRQARGSLDLVAQLEAELELQVEISQVRIEQEQAQQWRHEVEQVQQALQHVEDMLGQGVLPTLLVPGVRSVGNIPGTPDVVPVLPVPGDADRQVHPRGGLLSLSPPSLQQPAAPQRHGVIYYREDPLAEGVPLAQMQLSHMQRYEGVPPE